MDWGGEGWWGVLGVVEEAGGVGRGFGRVGMLFCLVHFFYYTLRCAYEKRTVELMDWGGPVYYVWLANVVMLGFFLCA